MLRLAADENFDGAILRGLLRRRPDLDVIRIQDVGLSGEDDPTILEWAAHENRVLLTHDVTTMTSYAYERVSIGNTMSGVFLVHLNSPVNQVIEDILLLVECSFDDEWMGRVVYIPL